MSESQKREIQVNVKMSEGDFRLLKGAAEKIWPDAILTNSGILLGLSLMAARDLVGKTKKKRSGTAQPPKSTK